MTSSFSGFTKALCIALMLSLLGCSGASSKPADTRTDAQIAEEYAAKKAFVKGRTDWQNVNLMLGMACERDYAQKNRTEVPFIIAVPFTALAMIIAGEKGQIYFWSRK